MTHIYNIQQKKAEKNCHGLILCMLKYKLAPLRNYEGKNRSLHTEILPRAPHSLRFDIFNVRLYTDT